MFHKHCGGVTFVRRDDVAFGNWFVGVNLRRNESPGVSGDCVVELPTGWWGWV